MNMDCSPVDRGATAHRTATKRQRRRSNRDRTAYRDSLKKFAIDTINHRVLRVTQLRRAFRNRVQHWLKLGAQPSDSVRTLLAKHLTRDMSKPVEAPAQ